MQPSRYGNISRNSYQGSITLLRPRPLSYRHLHFPAVLVQEDEFVLLGCEFDRVANDQSFARTTGTTPHALVARGVDHVIDLDGEHGTSDGGARTQLLVIGDIDELAGLKLMFGSTGRS